MLAAMNAAAISGAPHWIICSAAIVASGTCPASAGGGDSGGTHAYREPEVAGAEVDGRLDAIDHVTDADHLLWTAHRSS
jgi:hypothetical protein